MAKFEWSKAATRDLISSLEALPELWDVTSDSYKNRIWRNYGRDHGQNSDEVYSSKWEFFDALNFMQSSLKINKTLSNL
ncbi:hypothetical protein J437_LFUL009880, partial [Ladona fulva]